MLLCPYVPFSHDVSLFLAYHYPLVAEGEGEGDVALRQSHAPGIHLVGAKGVEHLAKLLNLILGV